MERALTSRPRIKAGCAHQGWCATGVQRLIATVSALRGISSDLFGLRAEKQASLTALLACFAFAVCLAGGLNSAIAENLPTGTIGVKTDRGHFEFSVEIASTPEARAQGLMNRPSLPKNHGMLFVFERSEDQYFWMKNTPLPLDIIFLQETGTVRHIHHHATPFSEKVIYSRGPARYVLEFEAGTAHRIGLSVGDQVDLGDATSK